MSTDSTDPGIFSALFWKAATERAIKTAAQAGILALGALHLGSVGDAVSAGQALGYGALGGAVLSYLTSLASGAISSTPGPSLIKAEQLVTPYVPQHAAGETPPVVPDITAGG